MSYRLRFHELALAEWHKLDRSIREPLKKKLAERLENPRVPACALSGVPNCYNIKLATVGYRLVCRVEDEIVFVTGISIEKRDRLKVYEAEKSRL